MHILIALAGIIGAVGFWYWRFKAAKETVDDVTDMTGTAWGKWKRYKFRKKAEASPVEAVDDPLAAAVIMMMAVAKEEHPLVSLRYSKLWARDLSLIERADFVQMVRRVAAADGEVTARQQIKIAKLSERLGLP